MNDIFTKMNSQEIPSAVDTVNPDVLIDRLREEIGISTNTLDSLRSYLSFHSIYPKRRLTEKGT